MKSKSNLDNSRVIVDKNFDPFTGKLKITSDNANNPSLVSQVLTTFPKYQDYEITTIKPDVSSLSNLYPENNNFKINFNDESLEFNPLKIQSSVYDYEIFAMLETIKEFIISTCGIERELFDEKYESNKLRLEKYYSDRVQANKIANELIK